MFLSWQPAKLRRRMSVGENIPIEEEEEVEHKLDESLPIINFASCTNDELVYARLF